MKTYVGIRVDGHGRILVRRAEGRSYLAHPSRGTTVGFDWGHAGVAAHETALAVLTDVLRPDAQAPDADAADLVPAELCNRFAHEVIAGLSRGPYLRGVHEEWRMSEEQIRQWIAGTAAVQPEQAAAHAGPMTPGDLPGAEPAVAPAEPAVTATEASATSAEPSATPAARSRPTEDSNSRPGPGAGDLPAAPVPRRRSGPWALTSLACGVIAFVVLPNVLGPVAVILGAAALGRRERYAAAGIVLGAGATVYVLYRALRTAGDQPGLPLMLGLPAVLLLILTLAVAAYLAMGYREKRRSVQTVPSSPANSGGRGRV